MIRRLAALLAALLLFASIPYSRAQGGVIHTLRINPYGGAYSDPATVKWYARDSKYYVFLPADADLGALTVYIHASDDVFAGDVKLVDGQTTDAFKNGGDFTLVCGETKYPLSVLKGADVPSLFISTDSGSLAAVRADKDHKEPGAVLIREDGRSTSRPLENIKGRGNSTWAAQKKPYVIKFQKKYDLFGMGKAKKWVLLASVYDRSFMRNPAALTLAEKIGVNFPVDCSFADVWANGEYLGLYIVCDKIELGETRLNITDLEKANEEANPGVNASEAPRESVGGREPGAQKWVGLENDPPNISGGYLLEADYQGRYDAEPGGFESPLGMNITIVEPKYPTKSEVDYIADLYAAAEEALYSPTGYNKEGRHYSEYFDLDSFARIYLVNEYTKNIDGGQSSFYMYKDADSEKLFAASAWDFDLSMGASGQKIGLRTYDAGQWYNNLLYYTREDSGTALQSDNDTILCAMWRHSEPFREIVRRAWSAFRPNVTDEEIEAIADPVRALSASALMNARRWGYSSDVDDEKAKAAFEEEIAYVVRFMKKRRDALDAAFSQSGAMLLYDPGEGEGHVLDGTMYAAGDTATIKSKGSPKLGMRPGDEDLAFAGWNTEPDGSGRAFRQGDSIILARGVTTLYAQWAAKDDPAVKWAESWYASPPIVSADGESAPSEDDKNTKEALILYESLRQSALSAYRAIGSWAIGGALESAKESTEEK